MLVPSISCHIAQVWLPEGQQGCLSGERKCFEVPTHFWALPFLCGTCNSQLSPAHYHCVAHRPILVVRQLGMGLKLLVITAGLLTILHNSIGDRKKWILVHIIISLPNNNSKQVSSRHVHIYYINHLLTVQHYDNWQRQVYMARYWGPPNNGGHPLSSYPVAIPLLLFVPSFPSLSVPSFPCL